MPQRQLVRISLSALLLMAGFGATGNASAVDAIALELGSGSGSVGPGTSANSAGLTLIWEWKRRWFTAGDWYLSGQWEATAGEMRTRSGDDSLTGAGVSAAFRLWPYHPWRPHAHQYVEAGTGVNFFSQSHIGTEHMSTALQFGSYLGFGVRLGAREQYEVGYRLMHFSNADIKTPNPGTNFDMLRLAYRF